MMMCFFLLSSAFSYISLDDTSVSLPQSMTRYEKNVTSSDTLTLISPLEGKYLLAFSAFPSGTKLRVYSPITKPDYEEISAADHPVLLIPLGNAKIEVIFSDSGLVSFGGLVVQETMCVPQSSSSISYYVVSTNVTDTSSASNGSPEVEYGLNSSVVGLCVFVCPPVSEYTMTVSGSGSYSFNVYKSSSSVRSDTYSSSSTTQTVSLTKPVLLHLTSAGDSSNVNITVRSSVVYGNSTFSKYTTEDTYVISTFATDTFKSVPFLNIFSFISFAVIIVSAIYTGVILFIKPKRGVTPIEI